MATTVRLNASSHIIRPIRHCFAFCQNDFGWTGAHTSVLYVFIFRFTQSSAPKMAPVLHSAYHHLNWCIAKSFICFVLSESLWSDCDRLETGVSRECVGMWCECVCVRKMSPTESVFLFADPSWLYHANSAMKKSLDVSQCPANPADRCKWTDAHTLCVSKRNPFVRRLICVHFGSFRWKTTLPFESLSFFSY